MSDGAPEQRQFLRAVTREEALARLRAAFVPAPLGVETVALETALGRVLADDVAAAVDVPGFDRANVDGFAVRAADTEDAAEDAPVQLALNAERLTPGIVPGVEVAPGTATPIATGGMLPRGADAVVMLEHSDRAGAGVAVTRPAAPGAFVTHAGADIARGESVLFAGQPLGSREIGLLAATGTGEVPVWRRPRVAILSTGDELLAPGAPPRDGGVYDSNGHILAAAVREHGGEPWALGIVRDDEAALQAAIEQALAADMVLLSGGTSKGEGDIAHRVAGHWDDPGIVVHGVAVKPGKPLCLAVTRGRPVVLLPGFPTSAIFTFQEFVAPVLRAMAGRREAMRSRRRATLPLALPSELGRAEYHMVGLLPDARGGLAAYPIPKGSGAVSTFSRADGFIVAGERSRGLAAGSEVTVHCLDEAQELPDVVAVGSHCVGLDRMLARLRREGYAVRSLHVGSLGGVEAARRGDCDVAGVHLLDPETDTYNRPWLPDGVRLLPGYRRRQGICYRADDERLAGLAGAALQARLREDEALVMVNRNAGSGTRVLVDRLLGDRQPPGWGVQPASHNAVAAAVAQGRADWGVTIAPVAAAYGLAFDPLRDEHYDFLVPESRWDRPAVARFRALLEDEAMREELADLGMVVGEG